MAKKVAVDSGKRSVSSHPYVTEQDDNSNKRKESQQVKNAPSTTSQDVDVAKILRNSKLSMLRPTVPCTSSSILQFWQRCRAKWRLLAFRTTIDPSFSEELFMHGAMKSYACVHDLVLRNDFVCLSRLVGDRVLRSLLKSKSECETDYYGLTYEVVDLLNARIIDVQFEELHSERQTGEAYVLIDVQFSVLERMSSSQLEQMGRLHGNEYVHLNQRAMRFEKALKFADSNDELEQWKMVDIMEPHISSHSRRHRYYYTDTQNDKISGGQGVKKNGVYAEPL
eukprot:CFRG6510T1